MQVVHQLLGKRLLKMDLKFASMVHFLSREIVSFLLKPGFNFPEGKDTASILGAKFIEVSSGIQHNVDELLVGIVKQIKSVDTDFCSSLKSQTTDF